MKVTELMIGDWVYNYIADIRFQVYPQFFSQWRNRPEQFGETIQPIPLTPEILEKNGFFIDTFQDGYEKFWVRNDFVFGINGFTSVGRNNFKIEYVHQLQHALRLCGIEKDIIL